ncbi:hypothetical protein QNH18_05055 [Bacillus paralicheniformis]|uniref:hypothetical protein n=1 Tax=Bacillus TaxID=1386 RepID=UPI000470F181|nr:MULTISPECIES: hypothetical protein [Bacillus]KAA0839769.1 hypothetical protein EI977_05530 [Bacillus paralicheniformis]KAA0840894.1 hypothetical protein EI979_06175 [Bacillus paralicheniformis]MBR8663112.1 hypothetical protein [Bacillus paralicheniformis]MCB6218107.1 hypothetical protein [Bacillus paralicheniformis]MDE1361537.1 hypothetical protein [Bacillus paralicheniformis]
MRILIKSFEISKMMLKMWQKEMGKLLNTGTKKMIAALFLILAIAMGSIIGYSFTGMFLSAFLNGEIRSLGLFVISMFMNVSIFTFVFFILFKVRTPEQNSFSMQLSWFPLTAFERSLGYFIPFAGAVSFLVLFIMSILLIPNFVASGVGFWFAFTFFALLFVQIIFFFSLLNLVYNLVYMVILKFGFPLQKFFSMFVLVVLAVIYGFTSFDLGKIQNAYSTFDYNLTYFAAPLFLVLNGQSAGAGIILVVLILAAAVTASFMSLNVVPILTEKKSSKLFSFIKIPSSKPLSLAVKEIKSQARNEENILNFIFLLLALCFLKYKFQFGFTGESYLVLGGVTGIIAFNSYGNDLRMMQVYKAMHLKITTVLWSKYLGLCVLGLIQLCLFSVLTWTFPESFAVFVKTIAVLLNAIAMFYLAGIIFPLDRNNPYMGIFSFGMLLIFMIPLFFIVNYAVDKVTGEALLFLIPCLELLLILLLYGGFKWRYHYDH